MADMWGEHAMGREEIRNGVVVKSGSEAAYDSPLGGVDTSIDWMSASAADSWAAHRKAYVCVDVSQKTSSR